MPDGAVIIDTRLNNKEAIAGLKSLRSQASDTFKQVGALEKKLESLKGSKLADELKQAQEEAAATAKELERVNDALYQAQKANFQTLKQQAPSLSDAEISAMAAKRTEKTNAEDIRRSDQLAAQLSKQEQAVATLSEQYRSQQAEVEALNGQRAELVRQLEQEQQAVEDAVVSNAAQQKAMAALNGAGALAGRTASHFGKLSRLAFTAAQKPLRTLQARIAQATDGLHRFTKRLAGIVSGALVFNLISAGLSSLTGSMGDAFLASGELQQALANLKGAAATAAAPIVQLLTPALTALANAAAAVFSYLARLAAFFTGTTLSASKAAAKGMSGVGAAASGTADDVKKAAKSLAAFDEINRLSENKEDGGGGAAGSGVVPDFDFEGKSPFLDSLAAAIEAGDWYGAGRLIGEKLRDSLNAIPWPDIQGKATAWAANIAQTINGAVSAQGLFASVGHTIAQGLNTITGFLDTFWQGVNWATIGRGLAEGLTTLVREVDWPALGRTLTDGFRAALLTLHGFVTSYDGWSDLGKSIAQMVGAALTNIDWVQAAGDLSRLAIGILTAINTALSQIDWAQVGQTLLQMLCAIDWPGLLLQLAQLIGNLMPVIMPAMILSGVSALAGLVMEGAKAAAIKSISELFASTILPKLSTAFAGLCSLIAANWPVLLVAALAILAAAVIGYLVTHWDEIKGKVSELWDWVQDKFQKAGDALKQVWNTIWTDISAAVSSIFEGIKATVRGAINAIIGFINRMVSGICSGLNSVIGLLNGLQFDVPDWVPGLGGKNFGFHIGTVTAPQIPLLAKGAVIPPNREFLAVLGDQRSGTNIEAPLDTIVQAFRTALGEFSGGGDGQPINIYIGEELLDSVIAGSQSRRMLRSGGR